MIGWVEVDGEPTAGSVKNDAKVVIYSYDGNDNDFHVKVTHEGVVFDIVRDGEVVSSRSMMFEEILED